MTEYLLKSDVMAWAISATDIDSVRPLPTHTFPDPSLAVDGDLISRKELKDKLTGIFALPPTGVSTWQDARRPYVENLGQQVFDAINSMSSIPQSSLAGWQDISSAPRDGTVTIRLTRGQQTVIDEADLPIVSKWSWQARPRRDNKGFYAVNSSGIRMHRLLLGAKKDEIVDHIDGDGLNNQRKNLRIGTQSQNCVNRKTTPGIYMRGARPRGSRWQSYIKYKGKCRNLGYYDTELEAHNAYLAEATKLHLDWMPLPPAPSVDAPQSGNSKLLEMIDDLERAYAANQPIRARLIAMLREIARLLAERGDK